MRNICVIGAGYVGMVTGACFADLGNRVTIVEIDAGKLARLRQGELPLYEPGLSEMVARNQQQGRLLFTDSYEVALREAGYAFICVGTPATENGEPELRYIQKAAESIAVHMKQPLLVINKSTVPVGTGDWVADIIRANLPQPLEFAVVSCPEFLREGAAIADFLHPDRIVLGATDHEAAEAVAQLFFPMRAPLMITDLRTAEMIKYASNAFLAARVSFINEIASICERVGADIQEVAQGMGYDPRINPHFLQAGLGFGGSCFPKDILALATVARQQDLQPKMLDAILSVNQRRPQQLLGHLREMLGELSGATIGILGLSFKENTDDIRESPSLALARLLVAAGADARGYDPVAGELAQAALPALQLAKDAYALAEHADALIVGTAWNEFKHLDFTRIHASMRRPILLDGRNIYEPTKMRALGFEYRGVGRS
ncbi:MAG: UDP-glucose/GDP-mannose dehydrogenase family protein [Anaerolineaceae bacterium]|nr:UDP-glucose/GDP-mannose dehydrogenase family protein [Anaerolineaceae bacterium]